MKRYKVLVTGCAGFIGFSLSNYLLKKNFQVHGVDNINSYYSKKLKLDRLAILEKDENFIFKKVDIASKKFLDNYKEQKFDFIIHLAAQAGVRYSLSNPEKYIKANLVGFSNILEISRSIKPKHFIFASTSSVYGINKPKPSKESDPVDHQITLYAASKKSNEIMAHSYSYLFNIPTTGVRFFTVYGPWGRPDMALFKFVKNIIDKKPIDVFNNGDHIRDFTYIDDIISGIYKLIKKAPKKDVSWLDHQNPSTSSAPFRIFNIGSDNPIELLDYIKAIEKELSTKAEIKFLPLQLGDVPSSHADISELRKYGYKPRHTIEMGIKNFVSWYREYYKK